MEKQAWTKGVLLVACGVVLGSALDRVWERGLVPGLSAAQEARNAATTQATVLAEVDRLRSLVPSYSHGMADVAINWTNLWFAAQKKNWPLARYFFNEARSHIAWSIRANPISRVNGENVDLKAIFDGIDTSSLTMVKDAIEAKNPQQFTAAYRTMLESCYACHKSAGKPMLRPQVPTAPVLTIVNYDPDATWPQ